MTRKEIEDMREVVLPYVKKRLLEINYENLGESDAEEFTRDFNEILDLAIKALEQEPILDQITEIIEPLRHLPIGEMSDIEWDILRVIDKYKAESEG